MNSIPIESVRLAHRSNKLFNQSCQILFELMINMLLELFELLLLEFLVTFITDQDSFFDITFSDLILTSQHLECLVKIELHEMPFMVDDQFKTTKSAILQPDMEYVLFLVII